VTNSCRIVRSILLAIVVFPMMAFHSAKASSETVWQVGTFDQASIEFKKQINYTNSADDPVFVVGKSVATKDWPAYQPGSANGQAGYRAHPFSIEFALPQMPGGLYVLKMAYLIDTPRIPHLQVEINGHGAWCYPHPQLDYTAGDPIGNSPTYTSGTITLELPTAFLRQGPNKLVLTAIDEPGERDDAVPPPGRLGDSGFFYDAVELEHDAGKEYQSSELAAEIVPTIFYKGSADKLSEIVEVSVRFNQRPIQGSLHFSAGNFSATQELKPDRDFGEQKLEFEVPESQVAEKGEVIVSSNGRSISIPIQLQPAKKWNVFVVPHEHLDIGYSDYQAKTYEIQVRALDQAIATIEKHPSFRYTLDGNFVAEQFLKTRSKPQRDKFLRFVREGQIKVPANYFNLLTGFASSEELIRSLYAGDKFNQEHGGGFDYASITDVPSYSWSYASVLASAGLKYLVAASNNERAPMLRIGHLNRRSPFLWEGPDGGQIPIWYTQSYQQLPHIFGLPPQVAGGHDTLPIFLQHYDSPEYKSDGVIVYGTQWENTALFTEQAKLDEDWNKVYAYPRVKFAGFAEAMDYITKQTDMPVIRGDGGPYWEDGIGSDAYYAALERENQHRALSAEKFATVSAYINPKVQPDRETLNLLWQNLLLFDEHCWEADRSILDPESQLSIQQRAVKDSRAVEGKRLIDETMQRGMSVIADTTNNSAGTLLVFNSLNWTRSSFVETDIDKHLELLDLATNKVVPYELLSAGNEFVHIRFWAADVPSVGYKSYALRPRHSENAKLVPSATPVLENNYYRITLDPKTGAIQSIFDKDLKRELVDHSSAFAFNQYVYVTGADKEPNRLTRYAEILPVPEMKTHAAEQGRLLSVARTPFGMVARLSSAGMNTPSIETEIVLPDAKKEIRFTNRVHKKKVYTKEGVYFAFPFSLKHPKFLYETQNGYVNPAKDLLPGAGLEWFSVQRWAAIKEDDVTAAIVPIDAPLIALGDIVRGTYPKEFGDRDATIFSYAMNNYWTTNYVGGQGGDFVFRYIFTSGKNINPASLSRAGWEAMSELEVNEIIPQDKVDNAPRPLPSSQSSFLQVDQPNVVMNAWKEAEDGEGTIMRFTELNGESSTVKVTVPVVDLQAAWTCNAVEKCKDPLSVTQHDFTFAIKPFQIVTLRIQAKQPLQ
jgi:alpha-mannosidase